MVDWKEYKIGELCKNVCSGGTPASTHTDYYGGNIPWLNTKEINFNRIYDTEKKITEEGFNNSSAKWISDNSVIVAMYGATAGKVAINKIPLTTNQACCNLTINDEIADYRYVYYYLCYKYFELSSLANGGAQQNLNAQIIKDFDILLPSLKEQKKISTFLSALDDKIEGNRRINENLEQQAQALFKSWFVDFEPFKDQPFVESELGMIPQGWRVVELGDLVEIIDNRGKTPPLVSKDLYPIIDVKALTGLGRVLDYNKCSKYVNHETYTSWFRSGHPKKYDILLSTVGSLAETKLFMGGNGCIAQNVVALRNIDYSLYLYDYLNRIKSDLVAYNIGSVQPSIKITHIVKHKIIVPQAKVLERYQILSRKLTESICNYCSEIDNLSSLRDELLPKLMSGEIEIN